MFWLPDDQQLYYFFIEENEGYVKHKWKARKRFQFELNSSTLAQCLVISRSKVRPTSQLTSSSNEVGSSLRHATNKEAIQLAEPQARFTSPLQAPLFGYSQRLPLQKNNSIGSLTHAVNYLRHAQNEVQAELMGYSSQLIIAEVQSVIIGTHFRLLHGSQLG